MVSHPTATHPTANCVQITYKYSGSQVEYSPLLSPKGGHTLIYSDEAMEVVELESLYRVYRVQRVCPLLEVDE